MSKCYNNIHIETVNTILMGSIRTNTIPIIPEDLMNQEACKMSSTINISKNSIVCFITRHYTTYFAVE